MTRFFLLLIACFSAHVSATVKVLPDLKYRAGSTSPEQTLDLYLPEGKPSPPVLVFAHGGAWTSGDKNEYGALGRAFASKGVAAAIINYRLSTSPAVKHPEHVADLATAIAWLAGHDTKYGLDGKRIFVSGHSAGAHMLAFLAASPRWLEAVPAAKRPKGWIGLSGIYDLPKLQAKFPTYKDWFLAKAFGSDERVWIETSPARMKFSPSDRFLLIHSPGDELVDLRQTDDFVAVLREQKVPVELVTPKGYDHFQTVRALDRADSVEVKAVLGFMAGKPR